MVLTASFRVSLIELTPRVGAKASCSADIGIDSLFIVRESHFFVIILERKKGYIADGQNDVLNDPSILIETERKFKTKLEAIKCENIMRADQCGTSAVGLAHAFAREYHLDGLESIGSLTIIKSIRQRLAKSTHRLPSESMIGWIPVNQQPRVTCRFCGIFSNFSTEKVRTHESACKRKLS